jgi:hypothetical protein
VAAFEGFMAANAERLRMERSERGRVAEEKVGRCAAAWWRARARG